MSIETTVPLLKRRRTKIVATLGPASANREVLTQLLEQGADVFRLNMSHGDHQTHRATYALVRELADAAGVHSTVFADLCGPKIRAGKFEGGGIELEEGSTVVVTTREVTGRPGLIPSQYPDLARDVEPGARVLLDDGNLELRVESTDGTDATCTVVHGGFLKDKKGINLPDVEVSAPSLTEKDRVDAAFALELGVDFLALSFVRSADDIRSLRALIDETGSRCGIIAKIEKPEALRDFDAILEVTDAVMVARGDLGVELAPEEVPVAQDLLVARARARSRPTIVATQMLESMIEHARPTRAEVSDVSHAVAAGSDAVMLSAESAAGRYPIESVDMMDRIARQTEGFLWKQGAFGSITAEFRARTDVELSLVKALARSTAQLSRDLRVRAIVVLSRTGTSAAVVSSARPAAPVVCISASPTTCRRMNLMWGAVPVLVDVDDIEQRADATARRISHELGLAEEGDHILVVRGFHADPELSAPSVTVLRG